MKTFQIGQSVPISGVKDAVVTGVVLTNKRNPGKSLYQVEYTVDDELARETGETRRHSQPWTGAQLVSCGN